ncbi:hypothetical protein N9A94_00520 [Akkermansiaceae bacterium]|nr:hypothetical protein [Akkermansiaceae bacterium]MDA7888629.1 hypothetical protein [Akkermansiaceae bacterium]MDB4538076.1 hypothetical protein [Akkermansiaceae bacterium]MDB4544891.1 hypothetical protein [Akkermansiaceae bacterium]
MEALLIPLAKGILGLMGISSLMMFSVKQEVHVRVQEVERAEAELKRVEELLPREIPVKPEPVPQKK